MKKGMLFKFISGFLAMAMLTAAIPSHAFAQDAQIEADSTSLQTDAQSDEAEILYEEKQLRERQVKHFRMSDGTYMAVQYAEPVQ